MSKVDLNGLVNGFSGKMGNAVLRRRGSRTYITQRPKERTAPLSEKQKAHIERFKRAAAYAKSRMADPVLRAEYDALAAQKELMTAFTMAMKDYMTMPQIDEVKVDAYRGSINDVISIRVADNFKAIAVKVDITAPNGSLIESGLAAFDAVKLEWNYRATAENDAIAGSTVKVTVSDRPGNETTQSIVLA